MTVNADGYPLAATVILLLPMAYFLLASLTFLLARLSDPVVTWMLRGLFNTYFLAVVACGAFAVLAFLSAGRTDTAVGLAAVSALAIGARGWFLPRLDAQIAARDRGDAAAVRALRRLHCGGMLYNALQTGLVIGSIPQIFTT